MLASTAARGMVHDKDHKQTLRAPELYKKRLSVIERIVYIFDI